VAAGSAGEVWLAEGPGGPVALKRAAPGRTLSAEASALRAVRHPAVVRLLDSDPAGHWLATEYAPNGTAEDYGKGRGLREVVAFTADLADGLAAIHAAGLVHGDVKPGNVLVGADLAPRIADVGGAGGRAIGTPGWTAPERLRGAPPSISGDIYGLGGVLYTMLAGHAPFRADDDVGLGWLALATLPEPPSVHRPGIPRALDDLVLDLLAHRPERRPARAAGLSARLWGSLRSPPRRPLLGMHAARDRLRRAIVDHVNGQPGVVVVHGAPGSGRASILREATRAARREGLAILAEGDLAGAGTPGPKNVPCMAVLDAGTPAAERMARHVLYERAPCLLFLRSERANTRLHDAGAQHCTPGPLDLGDITTLCRLWGVDASLAGDIAGETHGHAGQVLRRIAGYVGLPPQFGPVERTILAALTGRIVAVPELAKQLGLGEHRLLDRVEPLMDLGYVRATPDGAFLAGPPAP
jgi:hypothetical protein